MWRSSSIRCLSKVIGETSCTDENINQTRAAPASCLTPGTTPEQKEKLLPSRKTAQNAARGLVQQPFRPLILQSAPTCYGVISVAFRFDRVTLRAWKVTNLGL